MYTQHQTKIVIQKSLDYYSRMMYGLLGRALSKNTGFVYTLDKFTSNYAVFNVKNDKFAVGKTKHIINFKDLKDYPNEHIYHLHNLITRLKTSLKKINTRSTT